jgi:hypothetical protein
MQSDNDLPGFDPCEVLTLVDFPAYYGSQPRFGSNPCARGYKTAVAVRRAILITVCAAVAIISGSLWACERLAAWQALLGIAVPVLPVVATEWNWRRSRFCRSCGARTKSPREASALVWCPVCHSLSDPARFTVEPIGRFELVKWEYIGHVDPVVRFLDNVLLTGIRSRAQEIRFEPEQPAYRIRFSIRDKMHELEPPPNWLPTPVAQAVKVIAGMDVATCDRRQEGHIHFTCGGHDVPADVVVEPAEFGPRVTLRFTFEYWISPCQCDSCLSARHTGAAP